MTRGEGLGLIVASIIVEFQDILRLYLSTPLRGIENFFNNVVLWSSQEVVFKVNCSLFKRLQKLGGEV